MYRRCIAVTVWEVPWEVPRADHSQWCSGSVYELNTLVGGLGTPKHRKQAPGFTAPHGHVSVQFVQPIRERGCRMA